MTIHTYCMYDRLPLKGLYSELRDL